ncbi:MAG: OFA family MFS transporter [Candidatus Alcyoniella australis]|nr:OFA family MFS transporter [Candidatus Alcyoniella australis]
MSNGEKVMNRWLVVVGAIMIQLCLGAIYAWSVFTTPLKAAGWTKTETQYVFAAGLALFAIVMVIAGRLMPKLGPRKLAMAGGVVLGAGYALAGLLGPLNFWVTFLFVGVVGGAGIGLAYVVPIAVGMRWFPDKKGMITGLAVAGFGFGAMLWVKLAGAWGHLLEETSLGLSGTFILYGAIFLIAVVIGGIWMVFPPEGWLPKGYKPPAANAAGAPAAGTVDFNSGQMLSTPQFYMILLTFAFGASAGLMSIGLMKLFPSEALIANGIDPIKASAIAGTAMAVFFSLANGIGRIAWGMISDKIGRKPSIIIMMATQGVFVILFQWMAGTPATLFLFATLIGFNFGGNFALFPTITADTFGTKYVGQNYGWVFLAYGIGGIFGPILGGKLGDMGNFALAFTICGVLCLAAAGVISMVKPPKQA